MDFKDFGDLMPDILAEAEMVYVSTKTIATPGQEAAYHNNHNCSVLLRRAHAENLRRIPLTLAKWLDYTKLCGLCEQINIR